MYRQIDYRDLQDEIEDGKYIRWCGLSDHDTALVQLVSNGEREVVDIDVNHVIKTWGVDQVLRNGEAVIPRDDVGYIPSRVDALVTYHMYVNPKYVCKQYGTKNCHVYAYSVITLMYNIE